MNRNNKLSLELLQNVSILNGMISDMINKNSTLPHIIENSWRYNYTNEALIEDDINYKLLLIWNTRQNYNKIFYWTKG